MRMSDNPTEVLKLLLDAKAEIGRLVQTARNEYHGSTYMPLHELVHAIEPALHKRELQIVQDCSRTDDGAIELCTTLIHSSGEWLESRAAAKAGRDDAHGGCGLITYLRRYGIQLLFGLVTEKDDDGNTADGKGREKSLGSSMPDDRRPESQDADAKKVGSSPATAIAKPGVKSEAKPETEKPAAKPAAAKPAAAKSATAGEVQFPALKNRMLELLEAPVHDSLVKAGHVILEMHSVGKLSDDEAKELTGLLQDCLNRCPLCKLELTSFLTKVEQDRAKPESLREMRSVVMKASQELKISDLHERQIHAAINGALGVSS